VAIRSQSSCPGSRKGRLGSAYLLTPLLALCASRQRDCNVPLWTGDLQREERGGRTRRCWRSRSALHYEDSRQQPGAPNFLIK
jgi:hypothetical protein